MTSRAKRIWDTVSRERLDELEQIHRDTRGGGRGRRWYTRQLNLSLFLALVAQFQMYSRNLHDDAVGIYLSEADPRWVSVMERLFTQGRKLERENPRRSALGSDFGRLGFEFIPALKARGSLAIRDLDRLDLLIDFRNAVAHGDDGRINEFETKGTIRPTLKSYRQFRKAIGRLVDKMDSVVAAEIATQLKVTRPW